jgi:DNA-binding GntR family transcriptional regulator
LSIDALIKEHVNLSHRVIQIIEESILKGEIKPGERIIETELAMRLGISKSPVREALKKLEGDGIVQLLARKGYVVKLISKKSMEKYFEFMSIVEPFVAKLAIRNKNRAHCKELDRMIGQMKESLAKEDYVSYYLVNSEFHQFFYKLTENEWIISFTQMARKQVDLVRGWSLFTKDRFSSSLKGHIGIANAFKDGDLKRYVKAVQKHVKKFQKNILESQFPEAENSFSSPFEDLDGH